MATKWKLQVREKKQLQKAKSNAEMIEQERINEARAEEVKNMKSSFEDKCLSAWDGSCLGLVLYVQHNMNNPKSFEYVETKP